MSIRVAPFTGAHCDTLSQSGEDTKLLTNL
jgi:hypothetical protein